MRSLHSLVALGAAFLLCGVAQAQTLNVGDPAPPIKVAQWVKGSPVPSFEKGKLYVVEFWATWCGPCRVSIPHLTELARKFAGKVTFTGVSVWERGNDIPKLVSDFVTQMGDKMDYNVCRDEAENTMAKTWMAAAGQNGIPAAFIVNGDGVIAWVGHPMGDLEKSLDAIIAGTFDLAKSKAEFLKAAEETRQEMALNKAISDARKLYEGGQKKEGLAALDKLANDNPKMRDTIQMVTIRTMLADDFPGARTRIDAVAKGAKTESAMTLAQLGSMVVTHPKLQSDRGAFDYGMKLMLKADDLAKRTNLPILSMIANAYWDHKNAKKAVEYQQKLVDLFPTSQYKDNAQIKQQIEADLAKFKAAAK